MLAATAPLKLADGAQDTYLGAVWIVALGLVVTALPVVFHLAGQPIAIAICVLLAVILVSVATASIPTALILSYLVQNLIVALISPHIDNIDQLNSIRAYNFFMTATVWLLLTAGYWLERARIERPMRLLIDVTTAALALIVLYFLLGLASNAESAATYLRNIAAPFLLFQIFALVAYRHKVPLLKPLTIIAALAIAYGYFELFAQQDLYRLVNGDVYINWRIRQEYEAGVWLRELQQTGRVMRSYLDTLSIDFLNTPLLPETGLKLYRLVGPNFHSISFAYALVVFAIMLTAFGRWWWSLLAFPLILIIGSKGALVTLALVLGFLVLINAVGMFRNFTWYAITLAVYAAAGVYVGIHAQDYHVIGFLGGLRGFAASPLGHGIGAGGNLSLTVSALDWSQSQTLGHTNVAVESAIGVLLYQMGVAGLVLLALLGWIVLVLWREYRRTHLRAFAAAALGMAAITVNGIFQEEAMFAPLALGLMCAFAGLTLGAAYRTKPTRDLRQANHRLMTKALP